MAEPILTLEYVVTVDDIRAEMARARKRSVQDLFRWGAALILACTAYSAWQRGDYWFAGFSSFVAVYFAFSRDLLLWWLFRWIEHRYGDSTISIEIDNKSLLNRDVTQKRGERFWWSRLTKCEEHDGNFELSFDGDSYPRLSIPDRAFSNDEQRATFRALVDQHLPQPAMSRPARTGLATTATPGDSGRSH